MPDPSVKERLRQAAQNIYLKLYDKQDMMDDGSKPLPVRTSEPGENEDDIQRVDPITPRIERGVLGYNPADYSPPPKPNRILERVDTVRKAVNRVSDNHPLVKAAKRLFPEEMGVPAAPVEGGELDDQDAELGRLTEQNRELQRILDESKTRQSKGSGVELERTKRK